MSTTVYLSPGVFGAGGMMLTSAGLPLNAGLLYTYIAGGTTPQATYTESTGTTQNANPIVLGADGRLPAEVWLLAGQAYRFDLKDSLGNLIQTWDNLSGVNDPSVASPSNLLTGVTGTNTITASITPTLTAYKAGLQYILTPANTNSGATTLNISGLGAQNIFAGGAALVGAELVVGVPVLVEYDGTQFNIVNTAPFVDTRPLVIGSADATKKLRFEVDGFTTATTRVLTVLDADFTIGSATQAQQEAASVSTVAVTPSVQKFHPSAAKAWARVTVSGGTPTLASNYNCASVTDNGTGDWSVNYTVAFSSADYAAMAVLLRASTGAVGILVQATATGSVRVWAINTSTGAATDSVDGFFVSCFGDQ